MILNRWNEIAMPMLAIPLDVGTAALCVRLGLEVMP